MDIDKVITEYNRLGKKNRAAYFAELQKKADSGDVTALFLTGCLQFPQNWEPMKKAALSGDAALYEAYIAAKAASFHLMPSKEREIHQLCYRGRKMGSAPILNRLAITYLCGIGCRQNLQLAKKYFLMAFELGMEQAAANLRCVNESADREWEEEKYICIHSSELPPPCGRNPFSISIIGTCAAGKTTLVNMTDEDITGDEPRHFLSEILDKIGRE